MRTLPVLVLGMLLVGAATLFAEPEEEPGCQLELATDVEVPKDQVEALVRAVAAKQSWQARVEATFLRIDADAAPAILGDPRPKRVGSARAIPQSLAKKLLDVARGPGPVQREPLPPLVLYDGVTGRLSASGQHLYIQDFDVETGGFGRQQEPQPIVGRIEDGTCVEVTARRDAKQVHLDVAAAWARVIRPIPRFETTLANPVAKVTIELPEMRIVQERERVSLPPEGGAVLVGRGRAWDGESVRVVLLDVRVVTR